MSASKLLNLKLATAVAMLGAFGLLALGIHQETAVGGLRGRAVAQESGNPIPASLYLESKVHGESVYYSQQIGKDGKFEFKRLPVGTYTLGINSEAHHLKPMKISVHEGKTVTIEAELQPSEPFMDLYIHQHVFTPGEKPQMTCRGFTQAQSILVNTYKVDLDTFLLKSGGSLPSMLGVKSYYDDKSGRWTTLVPDLDNNPSVKRVDSFSIHNIKRDAEGIFNQRIDLARLGPGLYAVSTFADGARQVGWIMVTSLGLVTKVADGNMLAYTVDLKTGAPVASSDIKVYAGSTQVASGVTGTDGLLKLNITGASNEDKRVIIARSGESFAFVTPWVSSTSSTTNTIYTYTDRPIYRPGQDVFFKGIVRQSTDGGYKVPAGQPIVIEVHDSRDILVYRTTTKTDRFGCYSGEFTLNEEAGTGYYTISPSIKGEEPRQIASFQLAAYRKPEFSVKVNFPRKRCVRGESVKAKITAEYYFGAPVVNAKVHYYIQRSPYWLFMGEDGMDELEGDGYEGYGGYGETVGEGDIRTDENGEADVEFQATWPQPEEDAGWDNDQQFTVQVDVTDSSERSVSAQGSIIATRGEFAIEVTPESYVTSPGAPVSVDVRAMDYDKHPVRNKRFSVVIGREVWSEEDNRSSMHKLQTRSIRTDSSGRASFTFTPKRGGDLSIIVSGRDKRGNDVVGRSSVWSYAGELEDYGYRYSDLEIVMDKKLYNPGDTAKVLINTKSTGVTALVTVEGDRVYRQLTVPLKSRTTLVEIPVTSDYRPNFYIGACYVKDKNFTSQEARARVSLQQDTLNIHVKPNRRKYAPGEKATYLVKATDPHGKPVSAELSLGVVDEAIYAIAEDQTPDIVDYFYARKENSVQTSFSFPEIYLSDPDKAGAGFKGVVRKKFVDTAFWAPNVITNGNGEAEVTFRMPDNLTRWRTTVRAVTMGTMCGESRSTVTVQKDLLVRLEMPRFLVQSDKSTITAVVHNYTGRSQRVRVDLAAPGLRINGRFWQRISVANGGSERVDWDISARKPGAFPITVYAIGNKVSDAVRLTLPVQPHGTRRVAMHTGTIGGSKKTTEVTVPVREDSIPSTVALTVRLSPSLAATMLGSLDYLAQYPYGCTEQTTSAFIPDVILSRSLKGLGINNPALQARLPDMVSKGLFRLYRLQLDDGGWSWCEYGNADPWMTAYVCYGLMQAQRAGYAVNESVLTNGLNRLGLLANRRKLDSDTRAYCCYVLTLAGRNPGKNLDKLAHLKHPNSRTLALLTLSFAQLGQKDRAGAMLGRLSERAISEPGIMHWSGRTRYFDTSIETTALALQAILTMNPKDPRAYEIVRWLMEQRRDNYWYSTRDTAMVLYAMAGFLQQSKELEPNFDAVLAINGKRVSVAHFSKQSIWEPDREINLTGKDLPKGSNTLEITKSGQGNLYYTTTLTQYLRQKTIPAVVSDPGLTLTRAYYSPSPSYYDQRSTRALGKSIGSCRVSDVVLVRLTVHNTRPLEHMMLDDYIPAGFEIIDKGEIDPWEWSYWWVGRDVRDDRVSFYLDSLTRGRHVVEYQMRAAVQGDYHALPAQVWAMYQPGVRSSTAENRFGVR